MRGSAKRAVLVLVAVVAAVGAACGPAGPEPETRVVRSPDGSIVVEFSLSDGVPRYRVSNDGREVIGASRLGFLFGSDGTLADDLLITESSTSSFDETWTQVWGEVKTIRNNYTELRVGLSQTGDLRRMNVVFRVFDDGIGFRYELPAQEHSRDIVITDELTEFAISEDARTWWIPAYGDNRYEYLYTESTLSSLRSEAPDGVHTPLTIETDDGLYLSLHEAALTGYSSMTLSNTHGTTLEADLEPWSDGTKVKAVTPLTTPWRTIQIADTPGDLITSYLILNLNEPNQLTDTSWITPGKYVGVWWEMHRGISTWGQGPTHGATTKNAERYIDFAAGHGFDGVLVEGWNWGWDGNWPSNGDRFNFTESFPDFDLESVAAYAMADGVRLIGHHETASGIANYESQMDAAFSLYESLGVNTVKTGYVGSDPGVTALDATGVPQGLEWHHGQYMVEHHQRVVEAAAKHHLMLDVHEPVKDTGLRRTWPNLMTREGARGQEYNAWSPDGGNPPDYVTILPFTRMLAGPMDYTPGIFDLMLDGGDNRVRHTLAKELALYVVLYSPLQMAADLPENYQNQPAFAFIEDVPVDWQHTRVLNGEIGDYVTIVRQDRNSDDWYLGSVTDEDDRTLEIELDFLPAAKSYVAEIYADGPGADWEDNPLPVTLNQVLVDSSMSMALELAPGGGQAIRFRPALASDEATLRVDGRSS